MQLGGDGDCTLYSEAPSTGAGSGIGAGCCAAAGSGLDGSCCGGAGGDLEASVAHREDFILAS